MRLKKPRRLNDLYDDAMAAVVVAAALHPIETPNKPQHLLYHGVDSPHFAHFPLRLLVPITIPVYKNGSRRARAYVCQTCQILIVC